MNNIDEPINIIGLSTTTSNEAAQHQNTIGKLWGDFLKMPIKEKLGNVSSSSIFAVYSDYEDGYNGQYKITIGYAVNDASNIPNGLSVVTIPAGSYKAYQAKSPASEDIVNVWKEIWAINPNLFHRNFVADFEEYNGNEVTIYIGYQ